MNTIFTITVIRYKKPHLAHCIAWFSGERLKDAESSILENWCDMSEDGYWQWAVIEEIREGEIYPCPPESEIWFSWDKKKGEYKPCSKPKELVDVVNFGIG
jgi:hypothetical protein